MKYTYFIKGLTNHAQGNNTYKKDWWSISDSFLRQILNTQFNFKNRWTGNLQVSKAAGCGRVRRAESYICLLYDYLE